MNEITLNHKVFPLSGLVDQPDTIPWATLSPYETHVLNFCRQWLGRQAMFTLRTSGSTGDPKSISITRRHMQISARLTGQALNLQPGDKALVCLSTEYIAGLMMLVRGFVLGLQLTVIDPTSRPLQDFSAESRFDFTAMVPLQLQNCLSEATEAPDKRAILNGMRAIILGGAPVSVPLAEQLQQITAPIYHTYGMTETVTHIALRRLNGPQVSDYFTPLPGVNLGVDERGCLTIRADVTDNQTVITNDLVELRPDGRFKWLGRVDHTINSGGVKVQIEKVEAALEVLFYIYRGASLAERRFFVGALDHPQLGQEVVAVVEGEPFSAATKIEIYAKMRRMLNKYEIPRAYYFLKKFDETPTGKIDRISNLRRCALLTPTQFNL
ncbi:MAG: AMP-binding protein [Anaerolineae bacterium]|nr:AMP-binding protein [Anaerolineae bacterium]